MTVTASLGFGYLEFTAFGYIASMILSFFMNLHYTFRVEGAMMRRLILFWGVNLSNLVLVELIEYTLVQYATFHRLSAVLCGMCWYLVTGFLLNKYLVFRPVVI